MENNRKKSRRFIPEFLFLDKKLIKDINSFSDKPLIKNISKGDKVYMYVSPLFYNAMQEFQRGRYSRDTELRKSGLNKFLGEKIPSPIRVLIKKFIQPKPTPGINMHLVDFPYMIDGGDQYKIPFKSRPEGESLTTSLFESNKIKKSQLRQIIREEINRLRELEEPEYGGVGLKDSGEAGDEEFEDFQSSRFEEDVISLDPKLIFKIYDVLKNEHPSIGQDYTASAFYYMLKDKIQ